MTLLNVKKLLKREWNWYGGSQEQKDLYIKTLERIVIEQDKRISDLEKKVMSHSDENLQ